MLCFLCVYHHAVCVCVCVVVLFPERIVRIVSSPQNVKCAAYRHYTCLRAKHYFVVCFLPSERIECTDHAVCVSYPQNVSSVPITLCVSRTHRTYRVYRSRCVCLVPTERIERTVMLLPSELFEGIVILCSSCPQNITRVTSSCVPHALRT